MAGVEKVVVDRTGGDVLRWGRVLVDPVLRAAVQRLPGSMQRIVGCHFGWCDEHGEPLGGSGGKAIRPALVLLSAQAVGDPVTAAPYTAAVELVHNFSLLHDDVMDGDLIRRHRPTAWSVFGIGPALLAGDSLLTAALDVLAATGHPAAVEAVRMLGGAVQELIGGQIADLAFERRGDVVMAECVAMAEGKTAALLGVACALGALFGGADAAGIASLSEFGRLVGVAFQHTDDLLRIWGDPAVTGKPMHADLRARKKSLPVVAALNSGTAAGHELAALYHRDSLTDDDLVRAANWSTPPVGGHGAERRPTSCWARQWSGCVALSEIRGRVANSSAWPAGRPPRSLTRAEQGITGMNTPVTDPLVRSDDRSHANEEKKMISLSQEAAAWVPSTTAKARGWPSWRSRLR